MEDLALVVGLMLLIAVASIGVGAVMAARAVVRRRPSLAVMAHAVLVPGTVIGVLISDTMPGAVFLVTAAVSHLMAVWAWALRRP